MNIKISQPFCYSAIGKKPNQEDALYPMKGKATPDTRIFLVCDGMGGHERGEVASQCVASHMGRIISQQPLLSVEEMKTAFNDALMTTYEELDALDDSDAVKKMGTTLTFLSICSDGVLLAHIGDSRIYQLRPGKGVVMHTRDHSLVNDLIAGGELTEEEARTFPQRNVITRAIQPHQEYRTRASFNVLTDIRKGDVFMLCSDGVLEQITDQMLCDILLASESLAQRIHHLEDECLEHFTHDNNTCYLFEVEEVEGVSPLAPDTDSVTLSIAPQDNTPVASSPNASASSSQKGFKILLWVLAVIAFCAVLVGIYLYGASR